VGIAATGFGIRAGSFKLSSTRSANFFVDKINKFIIDKISKFFRRQDQQVHHRQDQQVFYQQDQQVFHRRYQQKFSTSSRSTNFATADSSNNQIASGRFVIYNKFIVSDFI
jgi:hypothetical protein